MWRVDAVKPKGIREAGWRVATELDHRVLGLFWRLNLTTERTDDIVQSVFVWL